jgi:hypothetical protein
VDGDIHPQLAGRFGWSDQYLALRNDSDQRRAPQRLLTRAIRGYTESVVSAQAIAVLRGITAEAAELDLSQAGVTKVEHPSVWANAADLPEVDVDLAALEDDLNAPDNDDPPAAEE